MAREFRVVSTKRGNGVTFTTNARTIGELKEDMGRNGVEYSDMQFCIRATQGKVYENDNDYVPPYDSSKPDIIMLTPSKTKNG